MTTMCIYKNKETLLEKVRVIRSLSTISDVMPENILNKDEVFVEQFDRPGTFCLNDRRGGFTFNEDFFDNRGGLYEYFELVKTIPADTTISFKEVYSDVHKHISELEEGLSKKAEELNEFAKIMTRLERLCMSY